MATKKLKNKKVKVVPEALAEKLTYRLSLVDSANRAVQVDVELNDLFSGVEKLMTSYKNLIDEEAKKKAEIEANDKEVEKKLKKTEKDSQDLLIDRECEVCGETWKGGTEKCPDPLCESNKK